MDPKIERNFRKEKRALRSKSRAIRSICRRLKAELQKNRGGCGGCKANALKGYTKRLGILSEQYNKITEEEKSFLSTKTASPSSNTSTQTR